MTKNELLQVQADVINDIADGKIAMDSDQYATILLGFVKCSMITYGMMEENCDITELDETSQLQVIDTMEKMDDVWVKHSLARREVTGCYRNLSDREILALSVA